MASEHRRHRPSNERPRKDSGGGMWVGGDAGASPGWRLGSCELLTGDDLYVLCEPDGRRLPSRGMEAERMKTARGGAESSGQGRTQEWQAAARC